MLPIRKLHWTLLTSLENIGFQRLNILVYIFNPSFNGHIIAVSLLTKFKSNLPCLVWLLSYCQIFTGLQGPHMALSWIWLHSVVPTLTKLIIISASSERGRLYTIINKCHPRERGWGTRLIRYVVGPFCSMAQWYKYSVKRCTPALYQYREGHKNRTRSLNLDAIPIS